MIHRPGRTDHFKKSSGTLLVKRLPDHILKISQQYSRRRENPQRPKPCGGGLLDGQTQTIYLPPPSAAVWQEKNLARSPRLPAYVGLPAISAARRLIHSGVNPSTMRSEQIPTLPFPIACQSMLVMEI